MNDDKYPCISAEEAELWQYITRDDKKLPGKNVTIPSVAAPLPEKKQKKNPSSAQITAQTAVPIEEQTKTHSYLERGDTFRVDGHTANKLIRGKFPLEGELDLHGYTQEKAAAVLFDFIDSSYYAGKRCVLVITGRGIRQKNAGVLREKTPQWLNAPQIRSKILMFSYARPDNGGDGALYVLLKKNADC